MHDLDRGDNPDAEAAAGITPDEIDGSFVPRVGEWNVAARLADEVLVIDDRTGTMNLLNATAGTIFECLDGEVSVDELASDLAEAFNAPVELVHADTLGVVRELGRRGLLAGVSVGAPVGESPFPAHEVGDPVSPVTGLRSDGRHLLVPRPGSNGALVVNWSPFCGYCGMITPELAATRAGLAERGIDLVLLTRGTHEDNLPMLEADGLVDFLAYRSEAAGEDGVLSPDPFGAMGTPAALLLDAAGKLAEPIAMGAYEVPRLLRLAAGLPEPQPYAARTESDGAPSPNNLPAASGMCAPSPNGSRKPTRVWGGTAAYVVGELQVGIRADSIATKQLLARALAPYRSPDTVTAPDNYSVVLGGSGTAVRELSLLLAGDRTVVRSRSPRRVLQALASHLSSLVEDRDPTLLETNCIPLLVDAEIVLLPLSAGYLMDFLQGRLARHGIAVSDEPYSRIDPVAGELVVPEPSVRLDTTVLHELPEPRSWGGELPALLPGRYRIRAWIFDDDRASVPPELTRAGAVAGLLPCVLGEAEALPKLVDGLDQLLKSVHAVPMRVSGKEPTASFLDNYLQESRRP